MHSDLAALLASSPELRAEVDAAIRTGVEAFAAAGPLRASQWADEHFYLSKESSYAEGRWRTWPFQRAILDCMGHDDIRSVTFKKSARVGYSKMLLAAMAYFARHKRRNQLLYQPTDTDAEDWVKTDLDTMLRDVKAMAAVFPSFLRRSKLNTLTSKTLIGSTIKVRGGTAAKNYRRHTVDVVYLDELDGFPRDIEKEGSPTRLSGKRLEGALFPKHILGSTPKLTGYSLIDEEHDGAALQFVAHVPCVHCGHEQPLEWGGPNVRHGFKWTPGQPETVVHMCARCGVGFTQADYLSVWERVRWIAQDGTWIDPECRFMNRAGFEVPPPESVAFHVWTAYSPQATWASIVVEHLKAHALKKTGDHTAMKTWVNTTRGLSYKLEGASTDADVLRARAKAETYRMRLVPRQGLVLLGGVDVQDNRLHALVWAFGRDDESWLIDRRIFWEDPGDWKTWLKLDTYLATRFPHEGGQTLAIDTVSIDTGGHFTHQVYRYVMLRESRRVHATQGSSQYNKPIVAGAPTRVDVNVDGQIIKDGVKLWQVGTNTAKDVLHNRLRIAHPGPGFVHISHEVEDDFFKQITSEERVDAKTARGIVQRWEKPTSATRNEDLDCTVLCLFGAARMKLHQYTDAEWRRLEQALCPVTADLFSAPVPEPLPLPLPPEPVATPPRPPVPAAEADAPAPAPAPAPEPAPQPLWALPRSARRVRGVSA